MHKKVKAEEPGEEALESKTDDGVTIPEQFQKDCHAFLGKCATEDHIDHAISSLHKHRGKMLDAKQNKKGGKVTKFSTEDMPKS